MFHKFSQVHGHLRPSSQFEAFSPQGFQALNTRPTQIIPDSPTLTKLPQREMQHESVRGMATAQGKPLGTIPAAPGYKRIQERQNIMLRQDGLLVWQKFPKDRMLYGLTVVGCVIGLGVAVNTIYRMSFNKK